MLPPAQNTTETKVEEPYDEEKDPSTPYLNPGYRADLYENTWFNIFLIIGAFIIFNAAVFGYFMIFFGPISKGIMYHKNMWWAFLIIFGLTILVRSCFTNFIDYRVNAVAGQEKT